MKNILIKVWHSRIIKIVLLVILFLVLTPLVSVGVGCRVFGDVYQTESANTDNNDELNENIKNLEGYFRAEESTYLTYPEWYIVYSSQEYGRFIANNRPSGFTYFSSIAQFWSGYCDVYNITREQYKTNIENHIMLIVIGSSFSFENALKGIYENTVGRFTEWTSSDEATAEDIYARKVALEYGDFLQTVPWYEFPFASKLKELWKETNFWGTNFLRKLERKMVLSIEYAGKASYGWFIGKATKVAFDPADLEIMLWVENIPDSILAQESRIRVVQQINDKSQIIVIPRYKAFTDIIYMLAIENQRFIDIAGNDEILLTAIAPYNWEYKLNDGKLLFGMKILTETNLKRIAVNAPVKSLHTIINSMEKDGVRLEHIYDY